MAFRNAIMAFLMLLSLSSYAQTSLYSEGADLPSVAGSPPTYTISSAGTYTVSGSVSTPGDGQDAFYVTVNSGLQITAVQYSLAAPGSFQGFMDFNFSYDAVFSPGSGSGNFSSQGLTYPQPAGTYFNYVAANFSVGNSWTYTYIVASTGAAPTITTNPSSTSVCAGGNTSFTVAANNTPTSYQWQVNTGSGYSNISNGGVYSGATSATLSITGATAGMNGYLYRATATNGTGTSSPSTGATLTVNGAPAVSSTNFSGNPACVGGNASFSVIMTGSPTSYQWQVSTNSGGSWTNLTNTGVYTNVSTATMNITGATAGMNGYQYRVLGTNSCGTSSPSSGMTLTVNSAPSIATSPSNSAICAGANTSFTVAANNSPTSYQWQVSTNSGGSWANLSNGGVYTNVNAATMNITSATFGMNGYLYRAFATNSCGNSSTSAAATLTVNIIPTPSAPSYLGPTCEGSFASFSIAITGGATSYQWQVSTNSGSTWANLTNGGVYLNVTDPTMNITIVSASMNGYQYRAYGSNSCGTSSMSSALTLAVVGTPSITTNPSSTSTCAGGNASFTVAASPAPLTYQWQVSTNSGGTWADLSNSGVYSNVASTTMNITGAVVGMNGYQYRAIATNGCGVFSTSTAATLTLNNTPSITSDPGNSAICAGANTSFTVAANNTPTSYQWQYSTNGGGSWTNLSNLGVFSNTTAATMNITGASAGMNGYLFRALATNSCGSSATSASATLTVNSAPSITTNPSNSTICAAGNTTFTVAASNSPTGYQWQVSMNGGGTWADLSNGGSYSGVTTTTLSVSGAPSGMNGYQYRAYATNGCGNSAVSTAATMTVNSIPSITGNPSNVSICAGGNTSFTVVANNVPTSYQWQVDNGGGFANISNGGVYSGATTATLSITGATAGMNTYQYRATATNGCGTSSASTAATLTVNSIPSITTNPSNSIICVGANTTFTVAASNTPTSYQWQVDNGGGFANISNGGVYSGATTATLSITGATAGMNTYQYRATATNGCGTSSASTTATLTVQTAAVVNTFTASQIVCAGANATFTITSSTTSPTYQWFENTGGGPVALSNTGIYSGVNTASLTLTGVTAGMNGYQYTCRVTTGTGCLPNNVTSTAGTLTVNTLPSISANPSNSTICTSNNTSFSVTATGTGIGYIWQVDNGSGFTDISNGGVYSNATTATLNITGATNAMTGYLYRCVVFGTCTPPATSTSATLTVVPTPVVNTQPLNQVVCNNAPNVSFTTAVANAAGYQWFVNTGSGFTAITNNATYSGATTNTLTITSPSSSMNGYLYKCAVAANTPCSTVETNQVTLTVVPLAVINTQPSNTATCVGSNATFSVAASNANGYQWQENTGSGYANISNGGVYSGATTSTLTITGATIGMSGYQYRCVVLSNTPCGSVTSSAATLTVNTLPAILVQPNNSSMTVCALAGTASCTTTATGTGVTYQWQENTGSGWNNLGVNPVITNNGFGGLTFTNPPASMNGYQYRCLVSGTCTPSLTSNIVTLTVNTSPVINTQALGTTVCAGDNPSFTIAASGTALTYQWQENTGSAWANITNGGVYSNATTATLNLTAAPYSMNGYQYRCVVSGTCSPSVTGTPVTLVVNSPAVVTAQPLPQTVCDGGNATFTTTAIGTNLTYQWYANYGSGFVILTNSTQYGGVTTNTLSVTGANPGINGSVYECRITTGSSCIPTIVATGTASLTVYSLPVIYNGPVASTICDGGNTAFGVTATGTGLTYQWQVNTGSGFANITNGGVYSNATTATLNLTAATAAMTGYSYRCVVSGTCTPSVTSNAATLTVRTLPAIGTHPSNVTLCAGASATFSVAATGAGLTYQWQENTGSGFVNMVNTTSYFNVATPTLSIVPASASMNSYQYRCVVSGTCTPTVISNAATLTVNTAPAITSQPSSTIICSGANTSYSVTANGTALTYQWQLSTNSGGSWSNLTNTGVYSNVTASTMNITAATAGMTGSLYRCIISGTCAPAATTFSASLTVNTPPAIGAQPSNVIVCANSNISFSTTATGTALTYQWQQDPGTGFVNLTNGGAVTGATSATLNIVAVTTAMNNYNYRCVVSGTCTPSVTTNNALLTVNPMITPSVSIAASATAICSGTSVTFTATPTNGGTTPVYVWKRGTTTVGTNSPTYTAANFLNGEVVTCQMTSNAACITTATVASNAVTMNVTQSVTPSLLITTPNNPVCSGATVVFTAIPTNGGTSPTYQWRKNGNPVGTGATTYTDNTLVNGDIISCVLTSNAVCATTTTANSNNITMGINPIVVPAITISTASTTRCAGQSTTFTATPTNGGTSPTYQWQVNGFTVGTNSSTYTTTTLNNGDIVNCVLISNAPCPSPGSATSNSLTMTVNPLAVPTISISSNFGTQACQNTPVIFTAVITNGGSTPIYQWRRNGSPVGTNSPTYTAPSLNTGDVITCILASSATCATPSSVTSNSLTMTINPVGKATIGIFASPDSNMCVPSTGLTFYSNYTNGGSTPAFQWIVNGTDVTGANGATFFTTSLKDLDVVTCRFSSSALCVFPEVSSAVTIHQYPVLKHSVNITMTSVGPNTTQFTANIINGGTSPSIQWYKNDKAVPGETNLTYTASGLTSSDRISAEVTSTAICATPKSLMSNYASVSTGIHNVEHAGLKFGLYPNPVSTDRVNLIADRSLQGETVVRLINKLGQLVSEYKVTIVTGTPTEIVIGDVAAGTYYLQVINTTENIKTNIKFDKN